MYLMEKVKIITLKSFVGLSASLSTLLMSGGIISLTAGCNHKKTISGIKWSDITDAKIKQIETKKATLIIPKVLKKYTKDHPFNYHYLKTWPKIGSYDFDSPEAKELFIKWFFSKIPNDKIVFEQSTDLCFVKHSTQKVFADYDFKPWGYTQIAFWIKDISK